MANEDPPADDSLGLTGYELGRAKLGDAEAMNHIVDRYSPRLEAYLRRQARSAADDPEGVAQEVWLRFCEALPRFEMRRRGGFWVYLKTIARNHMARQGAKNRKQPDETVSGLADSYHEPTEALIKREEIARFEEILADLNERERNALYMRVEGEPYAAVAAQCGFPSEDAARMALDRAIKRLRERLEWA